MFFSLEIRVTKNVIRITKCQQIFVVVSFLKREEARPARLKPTAKTAAPASRGLPQHVQEAQQQGACLQLALAKGQRLGVYGAAVAFGGATYYNGPVIELPTPY